MIKKNLLAVGFDEVILMESKGWSSQKGIKFDLKKDQAIMIPTQVKKLMLGLGWDTRLDIDASILLLDKDGKYFDHVSYSKLQSNDKSIKHMGDNTTGEGDGDDEEIVIDLNKLDKRVD